MARKGHKKNKQIANSKSPCNSPSFEPSLGENGDLHKNGCDDGRSSMTMAVSMDDNPVHSSNPVVIPTRVSSLKELLDNMDNPMQNGSLTLKTMDEIRKQIRMLYGLFRMIR